MAVNTINWNGAPNSTPDAFSCQITYAAGDVLYDTVTAGNIPAGSVMAAIDAFIVSRGWVRVLNTNATGGGKIGAYCYRAANLLDSTGAASNKFITIDLATAQKIYIKVWENISADATAPLNLAPLSDGILGQVSAHTDGSATNPGTFWLGASLRHIVLHSLCIGVYGNSGTQADYGPIGCFELTRASALETVALGFPKHVHVATGLLFNNLAQGSVVSTTRTRNGTVASNSAVTSYGAGGQSNNANNNCMGSMPAFQSALHAKPAASNITINSLNTTALNTEVLGTLINLVAITRNYGSIIGDDIGLPVKADPNYAAQKFYDITGVEERYWLLGGSALGQGRIAVPK
jgi:hypothetical protein